MPTEPVASIWTPRLELVSMNLAFMRALVAHDLAVASAELGVDVSEEMTEDLVNFARYRLAQMEADPSIQPWLARAMVRTEPDGNRNAIGTLGFHGPPDERNVVEVGYRIEAPYRRQGYTSEAVRGLFDWAYREHGIRRFRASISPTNAASLNLAAGFGFRQVGEQMDEIDGLELVFETDWPQPAAGEIRSAGSAGGSARA